MHLDDGRGPLHPSPRRPNPRTPTLLILAQPRLVRLSKHTLPAEVQHMPNNDKNKSNRVHPVNMKMEDLNTNSHTPKVSSQKRNIEERGRGKTEHERSERVEERENEGVPGEVTPNFRVPDRGGELSTVEDPSLNTIDEHSPESQLSNNLIHGLLRHQEFLQDIGETVEGGTEEREQVALHSVGGGKRVVTGQVVGAEENSHAAQTDDYAGVLGKVVAHLEEDEGDKYDDYDGPEVD